MRKKQTLKPGERELLLVVDCLDSRFIQNHCFISFPDMSSHAMAWHIMPHYTRLDYTALLLTWLSMSTSFPFPSSPHCAPNTTSMLCLLFFDDAGATTGAPDFDDNPSEDSISLTVLVISVKTAARFSGVTLTPFVLMFCNVTAVGAATMISSSGSLVSSVGASSEGCADR